MAKETMKAIFKVAKDSGECVAFLPDIPSSPMTIFSYMHNGQSGEACRDFFYECRPATIEESKDLEKEIARVYDFVEGNVEIVRAKRLPRWWSWFGRF